MGKLSDILQNGDGERIRQAWNDTQAADEFGPLPAGEYTAHIIDGDLEQSRRKGTPGYKLTFKIIEGDYTGRQFWLDLWLTEAALPQTKRDLRKLGVTDLSQLEQPLPRFIRCKCKVALRRDDDGTEYNRVRRFDALGIDKPTPDEFAPADDSAEADDETANGQSEVAP